VACGAVVVADIGDCHTDTADSPDRNSRQSTRRGPAQ
jgi:hypothetical protein